MKSKTMSLQVSYPLTVFYDGNCPLCVAEMTAIKARDAHQRIVLENCAVPGFDPVRFGAAADALPAMLRLLHARDAAGRWFIGVDVFVLLYSAAGLGVFAAVWRNRWLRPLWDRLYPWIAANRYRLTALGLHHPYLWLARQAARRAAQRSSACADGRCALPAEPNPASDRKAHETP